MPLVDGRVIGEEAAVGDVEDLGVGAAAVDVEHANVRTAARAGARDDLVTVLRIAVEVAGRDVDAAGEVRVVREEAGEQVARRVEDAHVGERAELATRGVAAQTDDQFVDAVRTRLTLRVENVAAGDVHAAVDLRGVGGKEAAELSTGRTERLDVGAAARADARGDLTEVVVDDRRGGVFLTRALRCWDWRGESRRSRPAPGRGHRRSECRWSWCRWSGW